MPEPAGHDLGLVCRSRLGFSDSCIHATCRPEVAIVISWQCNWGLVVLDIFSPDVLVSVVKGVKSIGLPLTRLDSLTAVVKRLTSA
jgi:hypothetical protein